MPELGLNDAMLLANESTGTLEFIFTAKYIMDDNCVEEIFADRPESLAEIMAGPQPTNPSEERRMVSLIKKFNTIYLYLS